MAFVAENGSFCTKACSSKNCNKEFDDVDQLNLGPFSLYPQIGGIDVTTSRNFFGRQVNSFETRVKLHDKLLSNDSSITINGCSDTDSDTSYHGVFIRAPAVVSVDSPKVEVLATIDWPQREEPVVVGVAQDQLMATAFHPELTEDTRWHAYFLRKILETTNVRK